MTDRFAIAYAAELDVVARIKDTSVEAVKSAAEILPLVEDYVRLRKAGGTYKGLCPFHAEKTPSFTVSPARGTYKCFGCGEGGDAISFVTKLDSLDFVGAIEKLAQRFGVEIEYEEISPEADRERKREATGSAAARARDRVLRARALGQRAGRVRARVPRVARPRRGGLPRSSGSATRRAARRSARRAQKEGFTRDDLLAAGLANSRGNDYFQRRLLFPLADARGHDPRLPGAQAPRRRPAAGEVRQLAGERPLQEGRPALRARHRAAADREGRPRRHRRGEHRCDRAAPGGLPPGRRVDGHGAHRSAAARVEAPDEPALPLLRLRRRRAGGDAARDGARGRAAASTCRSSRSRRAPILPTIRRRSRRTSHGPSAIPSTACASLHDARARQERVVAAIREFLGSLPDSPERQDALRLAPICSTFRPRCRRGSRRRGGSGAVDRRRLASAARRGDAARAAARSRASSRIPSSSSSSPSSARSTSTIQLHRRACAHLLGQAPADEELTPLLAELYALADEESITEQTAEQLLLAAARAAAPARALGAPRADEAGSSTSSRRC